MQVASISIQSAGKRFIKEWIFQKLDLEIKSGEKIVILGSNGSGKSTLLQCIAGYQFITQGKIIWSQTDGTPIEEENIFHQLSFASPYMELIEEFTPKEHLLHQAKFKKFQNDLNADEILKICMLEKSGDKQIRFFSSGMKQRFKLALAILSDAPVLMLDEPLSNLDATGVSWYNEMIHQYAQHKMIFVCSNNIKDEFKFCERSINLEDFK